MMSVQVQEERSIDIDPARTAEGPLDLGNIVSEISGWTFTGWDSA